EVVRDRQHEAVVRDVTPLDLAEPGAEGRVVEGPLEPTGDLGPQGLCSQLDWLFHPRGPSSSIDDRSGEHSNVPCVFQWCPLGTFSRAEIADLQGFQPDPHYSPQVWTGPLERVTDALEKRPCARAFRVRSVHTRPV